MQRLLDGVIRQHFDDNRQMLFLTGPRQVGKTTCAMAAAERFLESEYLNWDNREHRLRILGAPASITGPLQLERLRDDPPLVIFDELHKQTGWKNLLKGLFDTYPDRVRILVTGSARLDVFKRGGDSLMGRYLRYRLHPLSVAELIDPRPASRPIRSVPGVLDKDRFDALIEFGGFPEPFERAERRFYNQWRRLRTEQLFRDDLRDLTRIQEIGQLEMLAELLRGAVGQLTGYASLSRQIGVSIDTVKRWLQTLGALYYSFAVRPWHHNVRRALRKEPKYYLWDWSLLQDRGARLENLVASALLKAVHFWTDCGFGDFGLHFLRDKDRHEVDFLVSRDGEAWFLAEVKASAAARLEPALARFQKQVGAPHAFQICFGLDPVQRSCFEETTPVIVPAMSFLSLLV